jgi:HAD superfamily hydrolase (TIGR01549 family)
VAALATASPAPDARRPEPYDLGVNDHLPPAAPVAAIFDWDGTIADSLGLIFRAEQPVMRRFEIPMSRARFRATYSPDWQSRYRELGIPEAGWPEASRLWSEGMQAGRPRAFPWVRRALRRLASHGVRLALVTASDRAIVERAFGELRIGDTFEHVVCADDVERQKPHPEGLLQALAALGVDSADAVYVGDTVVDLEMARAAGVRFVPIGGTIDDDAFHVRDARPVWPSVAAWAAHVLDPVSRA